MQDLTTHTSSSIFISSLDFDYIETYSFQRGEDYEVKYKNEYEKLREKKQKNDLTINEQERFEKLNNLLYGVNKFLIDSCGHFHFSSQKISTHKKNNDAVNDLIDALNIQITEKHDWMCAPFYRDAIVFYTNDNKMVCTLNVCLSCEHMQLDLNNHIDGDYKTYKLLRKFFVDCGHQIENYS